MCQKHEKNNEKNYIYTSMLCKWFTVIHSKAKPVATPMVVRKGKSSYDGMNITAKCTMSEGWLQKMGTASKSGIFDNVTPVQCHGCQSKGLLLYIVFYK